MVKNPLIPSLNSRLEEFRASHGEKLNRWRKRVPMGDLKSRMEILEELCREKGLIT